MKIHTLILVAFCLSLAPGQTLLAASQTPSRTIEAPQGRLIFQTSRAWSPRINIDADTVMVYGVDGTTAERIRSWKAHGYHVDLMTGGAWGRYRAYLGGSFDGKQHWNETQQEKNGNLMLHGGRDIPYISPNRSYGLYLSKEIESALDAGAQAVYLEEPEFWARAGWSTSFRNQWQDEYHQAWQAPDSSPDAQYRASQLKYYLYRRTLAQIFQSVKAYGAKHHRSIPCYVATHSLINYAQWHIVSPESSLLKVGADGYIAQVWTGTARTPNVYEGVLRERTFETAFLEYGVLQNIARSSGKPIWYLDDPIEDNPHHSWSDYRKNWESTLVASLLQPAVSRYEVLPWPERIFGEGFAYPATEPSPSNPNPAKIPIPEAYATELQTVFHALAEMQQPAAETHWESAGNRGIGVLVSDTLMFERASPDPSAPSLGEFYGLALPLLMRGMPVEPVQMESVRPGSVTVGALGRYKVLLLTYDGQKPPDPDSQTALVAWVHSGGALIVFDDDKDPYDKIHAWWRDKDGKVQTPCDLLFQELGLKPGSSGLHSVGRGFVLYEAKNPAALTYLPAGQEVVYDSLQTVAKVIGLPLCQTHVLVLRRGHYVIAAGLDAEGSEQQSQPLRPLSVAGDFINLFDNNLAESDHFTIQPGERALLLDVNSFRSSRPRILAASAKVTLEREGKNRLTFQVEGIEDTHGVVRILSARAAREIDLGGKPLDPASYEYNGRTLLIRFKNTAAPQQIEVVFR